MQQLIYIGILILAGISLKAQDIVELKGGALELNNSDYQFIGANLWQAVPWAMERPTLLKVELDALEKMGVKNLRILASAQGPSSSPWRIRQYLEQAPNQIDSSWLQGLDLVLDELAKRDMKAVLYLGNFWHWSGGFAQYINWATADPIPYPPPAAGGDWQNFEKYAARFYKNRKAKSYYRKAVKQIIERQNSINGRSYKSDPTIMAWQLCNEPRAARSPRAFRRWLDHSAHELKKMGVQQLVSTGSEGLATNWQSPKEQRRWKKAHQSQQIDYLTLHLWPQNWDWYDPQSSDSLPLEQIKAYIQVHLKIAKALNKPLVLEEFGLARDEGSYEPEVSDDQRRAFYELIFTLLKEESALVGCNFWAWAGQNYPKEAGALWDKGDPYTGDPPHERQGWYAVYASDLLIIDLIKAYQALLDDQK